MSRRIHHSAISLSMALEPFVGPWPLLSFLILHTVGRLLGRGISQSQCLYLHTEQQKHRINAYTDIHALSGIRTHDPSARSGEDGSCLRQRDHCDRPTILIKRKLTQ
jgi:hypothetical protein